MLVIHPGYPKTGTTFLQTLLKDREWYFGLLSGDATSKRFCDAVRGNNRSDSFPEIVREIVARVTPGQSTLLSEEALLSLRPYEIAYQVGLYSNLDAQNVKAGALEEPVHKLLNVAEAVRETDRAWLLTVRRHRDWCRSYYRYTLSELGQRRAALYLASLAQAQVVGGPLYSPTIRLIRAIDPDAPLLVLPMEALVDPAHQAEVTRFFAERFGLDVPLISGGAAVNASTPPLPAAYTRFVRSMSHISWPGPPRRAARTLESLVHSSLDRVARGDTAKFEAGIACLAGSFQRDVAALQAHSPFDLKAFGYGG